MSKTFRPWKIDEPLFLPPTVQDFVAADHLACFVLSLVRDDVDLTKVTGTYGSERGQPPFDPTMMTALLLYAHCCGIYSSRRIAKACGERVDFMSIVGLDAPDFRTISDFRKRHLKALGELFKQVLHLCEKAGLVKLCDRARVWSPWLPITTSLSVKITLCPATLVRNVPIAHSAYCAARSP
jgi:transposase